MVATGGVLAIQNSPSELLRPQGDTNSPIRNVNWTGPPRQTAVVGYRGEPARQPPRRSLASMPHALLERLVDPEPGIDRAWLGGTGAHLAVVVLYPRPPR